MSYCQHCADLMKSESELLRALEDTEAELATAKEVLADYQYTLECCSTSPSVGKFVDGELRKHKDAVARLLGEE